MEFEFRALGDCEMEYEKYKPIICEQCKGKMNLLNRIVIDSYGYMSVHYVCSCGFGVIKPIKIGDKNG